MLSVPTLSRDVQEDAIRGVATILQQHKQEVNAALQKSEQKAEQLEAQLRKSDLALQLRIERLKALLDQARTSLPSFTGDP